MVEGAQVSRQEANPSGKPDNDQMVASDFLSTMINMAVRVTATDGRVFRGVLKCTDNESNVVLANTHEYRRPPVNKQVPKFVSDPASNPNKLEMTSRFLGLVVIPGEHIVTMQLEMFASQYNEVLKKRAQKETNTTDTE